VATYVSDQQRVYDALETILDAAPLAVRDVTAGQITKSTGLSLQVVTDCLDHLATRAVLYLIPADDPNATKAVPYHQRPRPTRPVEYPWLMFKT
jgi:hypothetical protein